MSPLFPTVAAVRQFVSGTPLDDAGLEMVIDAVDQYIVTEAGAHCVQASDTLTIDGQYQDGLYLPRGARQVDMVSTLNAIGDPDDVIDAANYDVARSGKWLLVNASAVRYGTLIRVVYRPVQDLHLRRMVLIDLLKNRLAYDGQDSLSVSGVSASWSPHDRRIVSRVVPAVMPG